MLPVANWEFLDVDELIETGGDSHESSWLQSEYRFDYNGYEMDGTYRLTYYDVGDTASSGFTYSPDGNSDVSDNRLRRLITTDQSYPFEEIVFDTDGDKTIPFSG